MKMSRTENVFGLKIPSSTLINCWIHYDYCFIHLRYVIYNPYQNVTCEFTIKYKVKYNNIVCGPRQVCACINASKGCLQLGSARDRASCASQWRQARCRMTQTLSEDLSSPWAKGCESFMKDIFLVHVMSSYQGCVCFASSWLTSVTSACLVLMICTGHVIMGNWVCLKKGCDLFIYLFIFYL